MSLRRPFTTKRGFYRSEWLKGESSRDEVADEAIAILTDPRDTVVSINVWSVTEQQFIGGYSTRSSAHSRRVY